MNKDIFYPLRRLHGWLVEKRMENAEKNALRKYLMQGEENWVLIPGTPEHSNLGDSAIVLAQTAFLEKQGFLQNNIREVPFSKYNKYHKTAKHCVADNTLIAQLGGGNMGSQWKREEDFHRQIIVDFPHNPMVIFPQTIYYADENSARESVSFYNGRNNLTLVAREQKSYQIMQQLYPDTKLLLVPDIVLSTTMETFGVSPQSREGILLCMRIDAERALQDTEDHAIAAAAQATGLRVHRTDMHSSESVTKENRFELVRAKMNQFASTKLVITDRLHGMIFSAITGTPCIVFSNYNHKVRGTYEWIKYLPYIRYVESVEEAEKAIPELLIMENCHYDNTPLRPYFEKLAQVVRGYANN